MNTSSTTQWNCAPHKHHQTTQQYRTADPLLHCTTNTNSSNITYQRRTTQKLKQNPKLQIIFLKTLEEMLHFAHKTLFYSEYFTPCCKTWFEFNIPLDGGDNGIAAAPHWSQEKNLLYIYIYIFFFELL